MRESSEGMSRTERAALVVKEELARLINGEIKDPRVGMVTVTDVVLTTDLREAMVYVSVYGSEETKAESLKGLEAAAAFLRHQLSAVLTMRHIPHLSFKIDDSLERGMKIDRLLKQVAKGETVPAPEEVAEIPVEFVKVDTLRDRTPIAEMPEMPAKSRRLPTKRPRRGATDLHKRSKARR